MRIGMEEITYRLDTRYRGSAVAVNGSTRREGCQAVRKTGILLLLLFHLLASSCSAQLASDAQKCEKNVTNNPDLALEGCTALIESGRLSEEDVFKVLIIRGVAYRNKGNYNQAIQDFDKAIRLKPDVAEAFNNRGVTYDYKGDYERAIQDYNQVIRLRPDDAAAFNNRGLVYHEKGEYDRAIQDFDQAIRLKPGYAEAFESRGSAYLARGDYDRAIQDYGQAIKLEPNYAGDFSDRAFAYDCKKDYRRALQDYDLAVRLNPQDAHIVGGRGVTRFYLGEFKAAEDDIAHSLSLAPTDAYSATWLYLAQARSGKDAQAELRKNSAALKSGSWPEPVIRMYLRSLKAEDVLALAKDSDAKKNSKQQCQVFFYFGEDALLHGNPVEARKLFQKAILTGAAGTYEYIGAMAELDRMKSQQHPSKTTE
jgi:lipoprotein NlpI